MSYQSICLCGGVTVGGCDEPLFKSESYRCTHCHQWFHLECIEKHFEISDYVTELRANKGPIADYQEAAAKDKKEIERLTAENAALKKDAERYRATRTKARDEYLDDARSLGCMTIDESEFNSSFDANFDAEYIDAAIKGETEQQSGASK